MPWYWHVGARPRSSTDAAAIISTTGGPSMAVTGATLDTSTYKYGGGSIRFDGVDDYGIVDFGSTTATFTLAFWLYLRAHNPNGRSCLFDFRQNGGSTNDFLVIDSTNEITVGGAYLRRIKRRSPSRRTRGSTSLSCRTLRAAPRCTSTGASRSPSRHRRCRLAVWRPSALSGDAQ